MFNIKNITTTNEEFFPDGVIRLVSESKVEAPLTNYRVNGALFAKGKIQEEILPNINLIKAPDGTIYQSNINTLSIKYHVLNGLKHLPKYLVMNKKFFDSKNGGNYGNFEFLIYLNFYIKQFMLDKELSADEKKTHIICTADVKKRIEAIWKESYYGPTLNELLKAGMEKSFAKQIINELKYFAEKDEQGFIKGIDAFIEFHIIDKESGEVELDNNAKVVLKNISKGNWDFYYDNKKFHSLENSARFKVAMLNSEFSENVVVPQKFSTTVVGGGSGFTPGQQTASQIHWQNYKATMIDGPEFYFHELARLCVDTHDIVRFILTHCHADHISFIYWAIVEYYYSGKILEIWTTKPIYESLLRILNAVTMISKARLRKIIKFKELEPGICYELPEGGTVEIDYSFHSVPALKVKFINYVFKRDKNGQMELDHNGVPISSQYSIAYSGDTLFDMSLTEKLVKEGIMTGARKDAVDDFVTHETDMIFYDIGGPPIHPKAEELIKSFSPEIIGKIRAYHADPSKAPEGLSFAHEGQTLSVLNNDKRTEYDRILILLDKSPFFKDLNMETKQAIAKVTQLHYVKKGERIVTQGEIGQKIYVIEEGYFDVYLKGVGPNVERMHKGDSFGEAALIQSPRVASVYAQTNGVIATIEASVLHTLVPKEFIDNIIDSQVNIRSFLEMNRLMKVLPFKKRQEIANSGELKNYKKGDIIIDAGQHGTSFAIVKKGKIDVEIPVKDEKSGKITSHEKVAELTENAIFGERSLLTSEVTNARLISAADEVEVLMIPASEFYELMKNSPVFATFMARKVKKIDKMNEDFLGDMMGEDEYEDENDDKDENEDEREK